MPAGKNKPGYKRPKRGERRKLDRRIAVDFLPQEVRDRLLGMYTSEARTWEEISALSESLVKWDALPPKVLELFPDRRVSEKMLRTWWHLRVGPQAVQRSRERREVTAAFVAEWSAKELPGLDQAAINTLADLTYSIELAPDPEERRKAAAALLKARLGFERLRLEEHRQGLVRAQTEAEREKLLAAGFGSPRDLYLKAAKDLIKKLRTRKDVRAVLDPIREELIQELSHAAEAFEKSVEARSA